MKFGAWKHREGFRRVLHCRMFSLLFQLLQDPVGQGILHSFEHNQCRARGIELYGLICCL